MTRILIIEDELSIRENTQEVLETRGFEVLVADNGATGLQLAKTKQPDLVLCDVMMPELDGYSLLSTLRQNPPTEMIPVILITARASREDQRHGMNLGADDYLTKPFTVDELMDAIAIRLQRQEQWVQKYADERQQTKKLKQEINHNQQKLQESQRLESIKAELLQKLSQDLRNPLSNINMAIHLLKKAKTEQDRDRYLEILQEECAREIQLLNEVEHLQKLLTPENAQLLQRFKLLMDRS